MITAVSLNPSIDRTARVRQFTYGGMNRVIDARSDGSGKAVNVAITAARLGIAAECIGFLYKENGRIVENRLLGSGVGCDFVWLEGRVRTNIKLLDESTGKVTEINEAGMPVGKDALLKVMDLITSHAAESDYLVLNGSLPPGCPVEFYREIIEQVEGIGCKCVLDTEGEKLVEGIKAKPFLIKPNMYELQMITGASLETIDQVRDAAMAYIDQGVENVVVSMGDKGALMVNNDGALYAHRIDVNVENTVGAGDAMVAGIVAGFQAELPVEQILKMGVAAGTATCMTEGTQLLAKETYKRLLGLVEIEKI